MDWMYIALLCMYRLGKYEVAYFCLSFCFLFTSIEYTIANLDMSGFKLKKEDVEIRVNAMSDDSKELEVLVLDVQHIGSQFRRLRWKYQQRYFPNLSGDGAADAFVHDGSIRLGFMMKKKEVLKGGVKVLEPKVVLSSKKVSIAKIELKVDECKYAWLYNLLASLFAESIREYITKSLSETLTDNMSVLLGMLNDFASSSWPILARITNIEIKDLQDYVEEDELSNDELARRDLLRGSPLGPILDLTPADIQVTVRSSKPLGVYLDMNEADNAMIIQGVQPDGEFTLSLPPELRAAKLVGGVFVGINQFDITKIPIARTLRLIKIMPRPLTLTIRLPVSMTPRSSGAVLPSPTTPLSTIRLSFEQQALGIRFRPSLLLPETLAITSLPRSETGEILPAEASGKVKVGQLLVGVNDIIITGLPISQVAQLLKSPERPMTLTLCENPDVEFTFPEGENVDIVVAPFEKHVVVTSFLATMSPLQETGQVQLGDLLYSLNGFVFPSPNGYMSDIEVIKSCTYPAKFVFLRPRWPGSDEIEATVEVVVTEDRGRLGVAFTRGYDNRPVLRAWKGIPGPAYSSGQVKRGMVVLAVGDHLLSEVLERGQHSMESLVQIVKWARSPVTMTFRDMDKYMRWTGLRGSAVAPSAGSSRPR